MGGLLSAIAGGGVDLRSNAMEQAARTGLINQQAQQYGAQTASEIEARKASTQGQQLQNALAGQQVQDQEILRDAFVKNPTDPMAMESEAIKNGISYNGLMQHRQLRTTLGTNVAKMTSDQAAARKAVLEQNGATLQSYSQLPPGKQAEAWPTVAQQLNQNEPGAFDPTKPPSDDNLKLQLGAHLMEGKMVAEQAEKAKTLEANANAAKATTETAVNQQRLAALKDPQTLSRLNQQIDATIPATKGGIYAQENNTAKQAVAGAIASGAPDAYEKALAAIKDSSDRIGRVDVAAATVPSRIQVMQAGNDIHQQAAAKQDFEKSLDAVNSFQSTAQTFKSLVQQALAGNSTANAQIRPMLAEMTNSIQGIKRMGGGQMEAKLGSGLDRLQGLIGGVAQGVDLPARVLDEIPRIIDTLSDTGVRAHNAHVDTANGLYGTNFPHYAGAPAATPATAKPTATGQYKVGDIKTVNGHDYKRDDKGTWRLQPQH